uniref:Uncharacterized protein LOC100180624 n=1 Tax=Phallusia mammillata TaxID=59560 RepID=A0A6F9DGK1_9ASCI|nr:uncharacterized protein LOC100180624 [Phallusia mammillata]
MMLLSLNVQTVWYVKCPIPFSAIAYGKLFKENAESVVTAGEDGIVRIFAVPEKTSHLKTLQMKRSLETKCGPALHVVLKDVTRLSPCDMLVADTRGSVVLFCDGQILNRKGSVSGKSSQITAVEIQETSMGHVNVIIGRDDGEILCFNTFSQLWRIRLDDCIKEKVQGCVSVTCILTTSIITQSSCGVGSDHILVADTQGYVYIIVGNQVKKVLTAPSVVKTMVSGQFLQTEDSSPNQQSLTQIALGCENGSIWLCVDFSIDLSSPYAEIGYPISELRSVPAKGNYTQGTTSADSIVDLLICAGHFPSLLVLQHGKVMHTHNLPSWPVTICGLADYMSKKDAVNSDAKTKLLVGCRDSSLHLISIT